MVPQFVRTFLMEDIFCLFWELIHDSSSVKFMVYSCWMTYPTSLDYTLAIQSVENGDEKLCHVVLTWP